ncbi:hypothetical protein DUI87_29963 [Hirundo rustica rustica]|uniref:Uncharacterized protein n=1 Tax=Hirundo rustica rustica TaxID=333673 RepID=A0A3M0J379_HIRRU|nr:hypothetical protein DUI87_29963 [Hirundo rustica rustica]
MLTPKRPQPQLFAAAFAHDEALTPLRAGLSGTPGPKDRREERLSGILYSILSYDIRLSMTRDKKALWTEKHFTLSAELVDVMLHFSVLIIFFSSSSHICRRVKKNFNSTATYPWTPTLMMDSNTDATI